jgi:tyrosine-specific transport protein
MFLKFSKALAVFTGTIIGVGIFGLPYVASKAGFFVVLSYFMLMTLAVIIIHLFYGEITAGTKELCRLPGYAEEYLGQRWKKIVFFISGTGLMGAILAYLIVGGEFLKLYFSPYFGGDSTIWTLIFFSLGAFLIFLGIKTISQIELSLLLIFFAILIIFFIKALPFIDFNYFFNFNWKFFTFPYGIILFSLWGSSVIPELKEMLAPDSKLLKKVIIAGITISATTYLIFVFSIFGASGPLTSKEAISGFIQSIGDNILKLGFIFGIITTFTSFITLGLTLKKTLWYDFGLSKNLAWLIACFLPLILFFLGLREYIQIIGFIGAVMIGIEAIIIIFVYRNFLKLKKRKMNPLIYSFCGLFSLGILFEAFYFFAKSI